MSCSHLTEVLVTLSLENRGSAPLAVFPGAAQLRARAGWVGPFWELSIRMNGTEQPTWIRELRTYYGPPAEPPASRYWESAKVMLQPGARQETTLRACWIPRSLLRPEHLSRTALDPDGQDRLEDSKVPLTGSNVLVLERTCREVSSEMQKRADFLRPGVVVFLPGPGPLELCFGYSQAAHSFYRAMPSAEASAVPLRLDLH